jgi:class 3 adenylate cyclase
MARSLWADDYRIGVSPEDAEAIVAMLGSLWGTTDLVVATQPSLADDPESLWSIARAQRASATPRTAAAQYRYIINVDVRDALPLIQAPTLVLHNEDNAIIPFAHGQYLADHIPGARLVRLSSAEGDVSATTSDASIDAIAEFVTGERPALEIDRVLTRVLFTDIVGSTERLTAVGDQRWKQVLDRHDSIVRDELRRHHGREVVTTGDGFVATFDGPARAIRCTEAITSAVRGLGIQIRAGLHTGECELRGDNVAGLAVHIAARVGAVARADQILVSSVVKDLVAGAGITFEDQGEHALKGVPNAMKLYAVSATS